MVVSAVVYAISFLLLRALSRYREFAADLGPQSSPAGRAQIEATRADADKRYQEAVGIRRAQDEISRSLTSTHLQYEAIQAQKAIATSGRNDTLIYVPAGRNGVPLVQDPQNVNRTSQVPPGG